MVQGAIDKSRLLSTTSGIFDIALYKSATRQNLETAASTSRNHLRVEALKLFISSVPCFRCCDLVLTLLSGMILEYQRAASWKLGYIPNSHSSTNVWTQIYVHADVKRRTEFLSTVILFFL